MHLSPAETGHACATAGSRDAGMWGFQGAERGGGVSLAWRRLDLLGRKRSRLERGGRLTGWVVALCVPALRGWMPWSRRNRRMALRFATKMMTALSRVCATRPCGRRSWGLSMGTDSGGVEVDDGGRAWLGPAVAGDRGVGPEGGALPTLVPCGPLLLDLGLVVLPGLDQVECVGAALVRAAVGVCGAHSE